jgi:TonB family protein
MSVRVLFTLALLGVSLACALTGCAQSGGRAARPEPGSSPEAVMDMTADVPMPYPEPTLTGTVTDEERARWPRYADSVYVDAPAEAIIKVPPSYPDAARERGVQGTVWVQALVRTNGTVGAALVTRGNPYLDAAAIEAVSHWAFKPAMARGKTIPTWHAVPVRFSIH